MITRFSPSPTGVIHLGNARTALVSYIISAKRKSVMHLRIEDTDRVRSSTESETNIIESLDFLGIKYESTVLRQTEQEDSEIYKDFVDRLIAKDYAYYCDCTINDLKVMKAQQIRTKAKKLGYEGNCRHKGNTSGVVRLNITKLAEEFTGKFLIFKDLIHGNRRVDTRDLTDPVILRANGTATYVLANTIDDYLSGVNCITRGFDLMPQTPIQILLRFGLGDYVSPAYCHLPLIYNDDGSKLSKRDSNTKSIIQYKNEGFIPEAISQYILNLSNSSINIDKPMSMPKLIKEYNPEKSRKHNSKYSEATLRHLNKLHIRAMTTKKLQKAIKQFSGTLVSEAIIELWKPRAITLNDFVQGNYMFNLIKGNYKSELSILESEGFPEEKCRDFRLTTNILESPPLDSLAKAI